MVTLVLVRSAAGQEVQPALEEALPRTTQRSVLSGISLLPAPATVARGGILTIKGRGLATDLARADGAPLPLALGEPQVEVLINGTPAPIFFVSPEQINAQVPWDAAVGQASVVVSRGGATGPEMPMVIAAASPELFTVPGTRSLITSCADDGEPALPVISDAAGDGEGVMSPADCPAGSVTIFATGLGAPETPPESGALGEGSAPGVSQRAYLDGTALEITSAQLSKSSVGVYEMTVNVPESDTTGGVLNWYSGNNGARARLGAGGAPTPRFMAVPETMESAVRLDLSDLDPYSVAVSGVLDTEGDFCYSNVHLLDFRKETSSIVEECLLPTFPLAPNEALYAPFVAPVGSSVIAALPVPLEETGEAQTNRLLLIDTASDASPRVVELEEGANRLQPGFGNSPLLRVERPGDLGTDLINTAGEVAGEATAPAPLPSPLEVDGRSVALAQPEFLPGTGGYRLRILGGAADSPQGDAIAAIFDPKAEVIFQSAFPDGWAPISPPRRVNFQGVEVGNSFAPVTTGFVPTRSFFALVRASDGTSDGVATISLSFPEPSAESDPPAPEPPVTAEIKVTPLPDGSFAANCHPQVRWLRVPMSGKIALVATREAVSEYAVPQENQVCTGDHLVLLDTASGSMETVPAPGLLDQAAKGAMNSYLFFADGDRDVALGAPRAVHVFDGASETFSKIEMPGQSGIDLMSAQRVQRLPQLNSIVAPATGGPPRTNRRGASVPPFLGNRGITVVDLAAGTARRLPLPEGFRSLQLGPNILFQQGRRTFGLIPLLGRAFAVVRQRGGGPGSPPGTRLVVWDVASRESEVMPMPEGGLHIGFPITPGGGAQLWDFSPRSGALSFGVLGEGGEALAIGVLGPRSD